MEIFVLLLIAGLAGFWWINYLMKKKEESLKEAVENIQAPYKLDITETNPETVTVKEEVKPVEAINAIAEPAKCGCGRSPTGFCVGLHKLTAEEWSVHADNPNKVEPMVETKKARKPRATKPAKVEAVEEVKKSRGRKPASAKKVTVKKSASKKS